MAERPVGHDRAEVGAADADVHHGGDRLTGVPEPLPVANPARQVRHPPQGLVDLGDDVDAVHDERLVARHP